MVSHGWLRQSRRGSAEALPPEHQPEILFAYNKYHTQVKATFPKEETSPSLWVGSGRVSLVGHTSV